MNVYTFSYKGTWLSGTIVIVASNEKKAREAAEAEVDSVAPNRPIVLESVKKLKRGETAVIYNDDGDY